MENNSLLPNEVFVNTLLKFFTNRPPQRLSAHLRKMLLHYISSKKELTGTEDMSLLLEDVEGLFELLDILLTLASNQETISVKADKASNKDTVKEGGNLTEDDDDDKDPEDEDDGDSGPWLLIKDFFYAFGSDDHEEIFWKMLKRALTNEADETSASDRDIMICFYEHLKDLIDASHTLWQAHKEEQLVTGKQMSTTKN